MNDGEFTREELAEAKGRWLVDTGKLVAGREGSHGSFTHNAAIQDALDEIVQSQPGFKRLLVEEKVALKNVCIKLARLLSNANDGNPTDDDHWKDVGGYSRLAWEAVMKRDGREEEARRV